VTRETTNGYLPGNSLTKNFLTVKVFSISFKNNKIPKIAFFEPEKALFLCFSLLFLYLQIPLKK